MLSVATIDYATGINTGVFLLRNNDWSRQFLAKVMGFGRKYYSKGGAATEMDKVGLTWLERRAAFCHVCLNVQYALQLSGTRHTDHLSPMQAMA
eukprot:scaffold257152_cov20-Prasinocladus_malaysianus.AAC.1